MKIALVSDHASPLRPRPATGLGGDHIRTRELAHQLAAAGHQVTIYTAKHRPDLPDSTQRNGVRVEQIGPPVTSVKELLAGMSAFSGRLREHWLKDGLRTGDFSREKLDAFFTLPHDQVDVGLRRR